MKIRTKLILWYFITTLVLLLIFSIGTYLGMQKLLLDKQDDELQLIIDNIEESYDSQADAFDVLAHPYFLSAELSKYYLVLLNSNSDTVYTSKITNNIFLPVPKTKTDTTYTTTANIYKELPQIKTLNNKAKFRVITSNIYREDKKIGFVIIGESFERVYESMDKLLNVLLFGVLLATLLILIFSYILTDRTLKPIDDITKRAKSISHENLGARLVVHNAEDELGKLTQVLNDLLKRLQDAFEAQQEFMADAAHELKTPLTVLRTHWESELNNIELPDTFKEKLVQDIETITRLSKLINNLLLLTHSEYTNLRNDFEKLDISQIIKDVVSDTEVLAELKNQKISIIDNPTILVNGDKSRLYQLIFNIIDNAIKYTPDNGNIYISLKQENESAVIEIKDNGIGIPETEIPHIFTRFYRVSKDRSTKLGGSGLGLAIAKLIAEFHNGSITVNSKLNEGSSFVVKIPVIE